MTARGFLFIFLGAVGCVGSCAAAEPSALKPGPVGIVCLPPGNNPQHAYTTMADDPGWTNPEVKGFCIRDFWPRVEPSQGHFDFSLFDQAVSLARQHHKFLGLAICAGRATPDWVYVAGAKKFDFSRPRRFGSEAMQFHMPIPWDPGFRAQWDALTKEFGKRYDSDPVVAYIDMTGPGRDFETYYVSAPEDVERFDQMGGPDLWGKAYVSIADNYAANFPHTVLIYAMGPPTPTPEGHAAVDAAVAQLLQEYPHQFGVCSDALAPRFSPTTPSGIVIRDEGASTTVGFQMYLPSDGGRNMHGGPLSAALELGVAYKAHYIEVYTVDCRDPAQQDALRSANMGLAANAKLESR